MLSSGDDGWWAVSTGAAPEWVPSGIGSAGAEAVPADHSPREHLQKYLEAEFVVGELDLVVHEHKELENGRHRIWFLRRIEEWVDIDGPPQSVIDHRGKLRGDPARLRERTVRTRGDT